jgi:hypothetical protein
MALLALSPYPTVPTAQGRFYLVGVFMTVTRKLALVSQPVDVNLITIKTVVPDSRLGEIYGEACPFLVLMQCVRVIPCLFIGGVT